MGRHASLHVQMHLHLLYLAEITAFLTGVKNGKPNDLYPGGIGSVTFTAKSLQIVS
jgi:hypothetical protein